MELRPTGKKTGTIIRQKIDFVDPTNSANPFHTLARGLEPLSIGRSRRFASDTLGATPPRDGPFALSATDVAIQKPPKARLRRKADALFPWVRSRSSYTEVGK